MGKSIIDRKYHQYLHRFIGLLNQAHGGSDTFVVVDGRKYDKVVYTGDETTDQVTRYMICRKTWAIYRAKSPTRPDLERFFGTLTSAHLWDWSGRYGRAVNDPDVHIIRRWGSVVYYAPIDKVPEPDYTLS